MLTIQFTEGEVEALIIQVGARIDDLIKIQKTVGKNEDIHRVLELEEFMVPIRSGYQKLMDASYRK